MAGTTGRLGLIKPAGSEAALVAQINANMDIIDENIGARVVTSTTRPASPFAGQVIQETDTGAALVRTGGSWLPATTIVCTSTTRPVSPVQGQLIYETDTYRTWKCVGAGKWMPLENWTMWDRAHSGTKKPNGEVVMDPVAFSAWDDESLVVCEVKGQMGFETVDVQVGARIVFPVSGITVYGSSVTSPDVVYAKAANWTNVSHEIAFKINAGASGVAGCAVMVISNGGQSYIRVNRKITRIPYSNYNSQV